jgi:hypothetical protein
MLIAWDNLADAATVTADSEQSTAPGANVQNAHVSRKWIAVEGINDVSLLFDMGSSVACAILAVLGSNLTATATLRLRGSDSDATGVTGEKYDSTLINAGAKAGYGAAYLSFTSAAARYWLLDLADAAVTTLEVGRVFLGPKWTPAVNHGFGWSVVSQDDSKVARSYGGQSFADVRPQRRIIQFTFGFNSEAEMYGNAFAMARANGVVVDVLAVNDIAATGYKSEQSVFGLCSASEPIVNENYGIFRQKFSIEERL